MKNSLICFCRFNFSGLYEGSVAMSINNVESSSPVAPVRVGAFKKSNTGKISALALGTTLVGADLLDEAKNTGFKAAKDAKVKPLTSFLCGAAVLMLPVLAIGTMIDAITNSVRLEKAKNQKLDTVA